MDILPSLCSLIMTSESYSGKSLADIAALLEKNFIKAATLTSIAHSSAIQAKAAMQHQELAANHADFRTKNVLAQEASGAAATAQAALVGKQVMVQNLKQQLQFAQNQLQSEIKQYNQVQEVATATLLASKEAQNQLNALSGVLAITQATTKKMAKVAAESSLAGENQHDMVQNAKQLVAKLTLELHSALAQVQDTEVSVAKAKVAAKVAEADANDAADIVVATVKEIEKVELHEDDGHK